MAIAPQRAAIGIRRHFTTEGVHPYDEVKWERRDARITNFRDGTVAFEQLGVEVPDFWSLNATNILAQKYFRGTLGTPEREWSLKQVADRVVDTITAWGIKDGYFVDKAEAEIFRDELKHIIIHQKAAFNSPVWFNIGVQGVPQQGSACFILSVDDSMDSILNWYVEEGVIFKGGSGAGVNLSRIRSSHELLKGGGTASGPVSFMRGADASAGTIKSGGKCFRAGTLVSTPTGWRPIELIRVGDTVLTHEGPRAVADFMPNGEKQCYRVVTREGYEVEVTAGHKFAYWDDSEGGFQVKPIEEFSAGESLYVLLEESEGGVTIPLLPPEIADPPHATTTVEMQLPTVLDDRLGYVLGLAYGDGDVRTEYPHRLRIAFCKDEAGRISLERFSSYCEELFGERPLVLGDASGHQQVGFTRKRLIEFLRVNGIAKGKANSLGFPSLLLQATPDVRAAFLAGVIDADGCYQQRGGWTISSIDREFLKRLQLLALSLGVPSKIKVSRKAKGTWQTLYRLNIVGATFIERFVEKILPYSAKAQVNYVPSPGADKGWGYRPSLLKPLGARVQRRGGYQIVERSVGVNETSGYGAVAVLARHPDAPVAQYARELTTTVQVTLETVVPTEVAPTYDIEVEGTHLLSANGIYASNTRRAAKMVILDADHPDIEDFIWCKAIEERKARVLRDAGFDMDLDGADSHSTQYQNANNSVRVTDEFMQAVLSDADWELTARTDGSVVRRLKARDLFRQIAHAAWECADPGMQFDTTINEWHTAPNTGRINGSNPCSEYMHLDNSACNLASLNLLKYLRADGSFDVEGFKSAVEVVFTGQEIIVGNADYPTEKIAENSRRFRELGIGYANLGALLMANGLPYDSDGGRAWAAAITALMTGHAYATSARTASRMGPFAGFHDNAEPMVNVLRMHQSAASEIDEELVPPELLSAAQQSWDEAVELAEQFGVRNSQASVLAPTGTIGLLMDCDTTGVEPDLGLVKTKKLVGGGTMSIVNQTVPRALRQLGYAQGQVDQIVAYIDEHKTILGAPDLAVEHLPVFACSMGDNTIHYSGHVRMMGAVQPFISGAISKTVNMPEDVTVEDVEQLHIDAWKLGIKAVAIYRDNCKVAQPLSTTKKEGAVVEGGDSAPPGSDAEAKDRQIAARIAELEAALAHERQHGAEPVVVGAVRERLPKRRRSNTFKFRVADCEGYVTVGEYEDGRPGEVFIKVSKQGSTLAGIMDAFSISISLGLQHGVPLATYVAKYTNVKFEPAGITDDPELRISTSLVDYIFRRLALDYLSYEERLDLGVLSTSERIQPTLPGVEESATKSVGVVGESLVEADARPSPAPQVPSRSASDAAATLARAEQRDAPFCYSCGNVMQRAGSCYVCPSCGSTSGCS
jgi:ribonucleoside-diphosphate reductase alpha chain